MAPIWKSKQLALLALSLSTTSAQLETRTRTTSAATTGSPSSTAASANALTTAVIPVYLYDIAESLLSEYFPTSTPLNLQDVTFPATVVIGSVTYKSQPADGVTTSRSPDSAAATATSSAAKKPSNNNDQKGDKWVGIIVGVVVGAIALAVMLVLFCCLRRRKRKTGSFFMRRSTPSMSSRGSRRPVRFGTNSNSWAEPDTAERHGAAPMVAAAALQRSSSRSSLDDHRAFVTPVERRNRQLGHHELDAVPTSELDHVEPAERRSFTNLRDGRPPTPFMMQQMQGGPVARDMQQERPPLVSPLQSDYPHMNPFASPEDREAADVVSPIVPPKSWSRRNSPMVHYPSMSEITSFDFSDDERQAEGGDGWRPPKTGVRGRHEMA